MDEEHTAGFSQPCAQCSAVDWGVSDEGRFYCRSCHNVIEKTKEVVDLSFTPGCSRVSTVRRGRSSKRERSQQWWVCEGFQFILMNQCAALLRLGVCSQFRDQVLCHLWRRYLQRSRQAYTHTPVGGATFRLNAPDSDGVSEPSGASASETEDEDAVTGSAASGAESCSDWSVWSGSEDAAAYLSPRRRRSCSLMSMKKTLALIHLGLMWSREALTLSDLLRLVSEGTVPYVNAYEELPERMKLEGKDALIFRVESVPSHQVLYKEAESLLHFLQLPAFPPIGRESLLHPALLSLRYLADANLPDELHPWVCGLMERVGAADHTLYTADPASRPGLPHHDLQAAALVIVTMKLLFGFDDHGEWDLSNQTADEDDSGNRFCVRRWYRLLHAALTRAQQRRRHSAARKQWKAKRLVPLDKKDKYVVMKKKRIAEQLQVCFEKLTSCPAGVGPVDPSSFRFCWGDGSGCDGPSLHQQKVGGAVKLSAGLQTPRNPVYWHSALRRCSPRYVARSRTRTRTRTRTRSVRPPASASLLLCRLSSSRFSQVEPTLPLSFTWLLQLFCFLLDSRPAHLYQEVLSVERRLFSSTETRTGTRSRTRTRTGTGDETGTRTRTRTRTRTGTGTGTETEDE